jgi:hypothetical protein
VSGDNIVVRVIVQVAPLPHGGVHPTFAAIFLEKMMTWIFEMKFFELTFS